MAEYSSRIIDLARHGAASRVRELVRELDDLLRLFPDLRDAFDADELPIAFILKTGSRRAETGTGGPRGPMSAAAREAVSRRMKRYWIQRRRERKK